MSSNAAPWKPFAAFRVFGDHVPMPGFRLLVRLQPDQNVLTSLIGARAGRSDVLDPELGECTIRAGLGLLQSGKVSFVYATPDETLALISTEGVTEVGASMDVHDVLVSAFASRLALLVGEEIPVVGAIYEFPDASVVKRAFVGAIEAMEESTPSRSAHRLGAQLSGRGEPFHPSMVESLEEQASLLESAGVDMNALPAWWWRGVAGRPGQNGDVEVFGDLPGSEDFAAMIA